jgi:hypothetical protein
MPALEDFRGVLDEEVLSFDDVAAWEGAVQEL